VLKFDAEGLDLGVKFVGFVKAIVQLKRLDLAQEVLERLCPSLRCLRLVRTTRACQV
jgi:hypothetical protein